MFIVRESFNPDITNQIIPLDQRIFFQHFLFWSYTFVIINSLLQCVVDTWRNSVVSLLALLPLLIIFADTHHCPQTDLIPTIKCKEESKWPQLTFWFVVLNDNNKSFIQIYPHAFFSICPYAIKVRPLPKRYTFNLKVLPFVLKLINKLGKNISGINEFPTHLGCLTICCSLII